jgi:hypothetical protein
MSMIEEVKEIADLIKKVGDADLYRRIVNLEAEVIELTRNNRHLGQKVEELQDSLKISKKLTFKDPYYWVEGDPTPYCPACWDSKKLATHIVKITHPMLHHRKECPCCKHVYEGGHM